MKTALMLPLLLFIGTGAMSKAYAQAAEVNDVLLNQKTQQLLGQIDRLLTEAQKQNDQLKQQLDRMGDPTAVNSAALDAIQTDLAKTAAGLKTNQERTDMLKGVDGTEAFGRETYGLTAKVEKKATLKDGTTVDRDPERYKMEAALLADIDEARRVRDECLDTRKKLTDGLADALTELKAAKDMASIQKQSTLIQVLQGQIAAADRAAQQALDDITTLEKEITLQSKVAMKAKYEQNSLQSKFNIEQRKKDAAENKAKAAASTSGSGYKAPKFNWERKGASTVGGTPTTP